MTLRARSLSDNIGDSVVLSGGILLIVVMPLVYAEHQYPDNVLWPKLLTGQIATLLLVAGWAILARQGRSTLGRFPLDLPALLFLSISCLSWFKAINPFSGGLDVIKLLTGVILFFAVSRTVNKRNLIVWIRVLTCTAALISTIGILQYLQIGFLDIPTSGQPSATLFYRNFAAMYLVLTIPLAAIPFVMARDAKWELAWGLLFTLPVLFLIYTRTRGAWAGMAGAIVVTFTTAMLALLMGSWPSFQEILPRIKKRKVLIGILLLGVIAGGAQVEPKKPPKGPSPSHPNPMGIEKTELLQTARSIFQIDPQKRYTGRFPLWQKTVRLVRDHWMTGIGVGNWLVVYPLYAGGREALTGNLYMRPHNDYLWIASELGLPGLAIYVLLLVSIMLLILRTLKRQIDPWFGLTLFAVAVGIFAISGHALFSFPRERIPSTLLFWFYSGILSGVATVTDLKGMQDNGAAVRSVVMPAICLICIAGSLYPIAQAYRAGREFYWALVFSNGKDWKAAQQTVDRSVSFGVFDYRIFLLKEFTYSQHGDNRGALEAAQECLKYHPNSVEAYQRIGRLSILLNDAGVAQDALLEALKLDPTAASLYRDLGVAYRRLGRMEEALEAYETGISLDPEDGQLRFNLAGYYSAEGNTVAALEQYRKAVMRIPKFAQAHLGLANSALLLGKTQEAINAYERVVELAPNLPEPYLALGLLYTEQGETVPAIDAYHHFLDRWEGDSELATVVQRKLRILAEVVER